MLVKNLIAVFRNREPSSTSSTVEEAAPSSHRPSFFRRTTLAKVPTVDASAPAAESKGEILAVQPGTEEAFQKRLELGKIIGKGNYAVVCLAKDRQLNIDVAVKCVTKSELTQEDKDALLIEVDVLFHLDHPTIIKLYGWYESPKMYWLSTELMPGGELFDRIVKKQFYKEHEARKIVLSLASCLKYMHEHNIVHRDIKPENILLKSKKDDDDIKIADFGFVAYVKPQGLSTTCGTPAYVAPEIISGKLYGTSVDMWSFGVIIYILLCGYPPFHHQNQAQLFRIVKKGEFKFDSPYWDPVSAGAKDLIRCLLELDVKKRFTAAQVLTHPWVIGTSDRSIPEDTLARYRALESDNVDTAAAVATSSSALPPEARQVYTEAIKSGMSAPWARGKLMLVGDGRNGKSSLVRSFLGKPFDAGLESTVGAQAAVPCIVSRHDRVLNWNESRVEAEYADQVARAVADKLRPTHRLRRDPNIARLMHTLGVDDEEPTEGVISSVMSAATISEDEKATADAGEEEMAVEFDASKIEAALNDDDNPEKRHIALSIWDFGGQEVFYALHHTFLTKFGAYVIVFDMSRMVGPTATKASHLRVLERLHFWLRSIELHAPNASIFIVGTHKDVVGAKDDLVRISRELVDKFDIFTKFTNVEPCASLGLCFWPVSNVQGLDDDVLASLRERIVELVRSSDYTQEPVPLPWIRAFKELQAIAGAGRARISLEDATSVSLKCGVAANHVVSMLTLFNELGVVTFFRSSPLLRSVVVLKPQWLVDALTIVIRDFAQHGERGPVWSDTTLRTKFGPEVREAQKNAIFSKDLLYYLWRAEETDQASTKHRDFLLEVMKSMSLAAEWSPPSKILVPSLLPLPEEVEQVLPQFSGAIFDLDFSEFFFPSTLFGSLLACVVQTAADKRTGFGRSPVLRKSSALLSLGPADFTLHHVDVADLVRVRVDAQEYAIAVREHLVSMVAALKEETMGPRLAYCVKLVVQVEGSERRVDLKKAQEEVVDTPRGRMVRDENGDLLDATLLHAHLGEGASPMSVMWVLARPPSVPQLRHGFRHHVFLSHYQVSGGDQCAVLRERLTAMGFSVWLDQSLDEDITEEAMQRGINESFAYLIFLSKDVFKRKFVIMEAEHALLLKRPIIMVHEADDRMPGYAPFGDMIASAPDGFKMLFNEVESVPYRRRLHEAEAMLFMVATKMVKAAAEVAP